MTGLIPLMLGASNRDSVVRGPSRRSSMLGTTPSSTRDSQLFPLPLQLHRRRTSSGISPSTASPRQSRPLSVSRPPSVSRRLSITPPSALPVLPYTSADWRRAISEIKRQHVSRRFRACFSRCTEILDGLKDTSSIEPTYLIYLHFYAATSMETCARPLFSTSPYRAQLLQDARTHYNRAAALIQKAEDAVASRTRPDSANSMTSSIHSPAGSVSSRAWTSETGISSPTQSICSIEDLVVHPHKLSMASATSPGTPSRKKVSFSLPKDKPLRVPFVRPDSPTLGFEDQYFAAGRARPVLPEPPTPPLETPLPTDDDDEEVTPRALSPTASRNNNTTTNPFDADPYHFKESYMLAGSVHRYYEGLSALKTQLAAHRTDLDELLEPSSAVAARGLAAVRDSAVPAPPPSEEMRSLDRQARIQRLRASGWQRKRFDFMRYERLRSTVMAELN